MRKVLSKLKINNLRDLSINFFYLILFLYGLNFFGLDNVILSFLCIIVLLRQFICHKIRIHKGFIFVLGFSLSYCLFFNIYKGFSIANVFYYLFFPLALYLIGSSMCVGNNIDDIEKKVFKSFFFIAMGLVLRAFLGFLLTTKEFGLFQNGRYFLDIWNYGKSYTAATGVNTFVILISCMSIPLIFLFKEHRKFCYLIISIISLIFSLYLTIVLQNRSCLLLIIIAILIYPILQMFSNFKKYKRLFLISAITILSVIFIFLILYSYSESFRKICNSIPMFNRLFDSSDESYNERFRLYEIFFDTFLKSPFGNMGVNGKIIDENGNILSAYFHNTWLDIYKIGGIISFIFFLLISILSIKYTIDYCIFSKKSFNKRFYIYVLFGIFGLFFFEPMIEANIYFFVLIFLYYGVIERLKKNYQYQNINYSLYSKIDKSNYKIVFISNFLSIHQIETHYALINKYGDRYHFISLDSTMLEHQKYNPEYNKILPNEVRRYISIQQQEYADKLIEEADVIIYGNAPDSILKKVRKKGKIVLQCSERLYKKCEYEEWTPRAMASNLIHKVPYRHYQQFCLTYSSYTAYDYDLINYNSNKCLNWGYWIKKSNYSDFSELLSYKNSEAINILFVNRLIEFKHPEKIVYLANYLKENNIEFHINIVGEGELKSILFEMIKKYELEFFITFCGVMPNDDVKKIMERTHIVISCSNKEEGWGACVNEAMTCGCCVVASHTTGSAYTLIKHRETGLIYDFENDNDLFDKVLYLCHNKNEILRISENAFNSMKYEFNIDDLIYKLDIFINSLIDGNVCYQNEGPLSIQKPLSEDEVRKIIIHQDKDFNSKFDSGKDNKSKKISSETKKISKGAIISYISIFLNIIAGLIYTPWMIKTLGQSNYGIYSLANSIMSLIAIDLGLGTAVSRFVAKYRAEKDVESSNKMVGIIFKIFIFLSAIMLIALSIIYLFIPSIYIQLTSVELSTLKTVFIMVGFYSVLAFGFMPLNGILMGNDKFPEYKFITLISRIVNILLVSITLLMFNNIFMYVFAIILSGLIEIIIKLIYIKKYCKYGSQPLITKKSDKKTLKELIKFSLWAAISSIMTRFIISIQPSILGITSGSVEIALFTLGSTIEGYVWQIANGLDGMFIPKLSIMSKNKVENEEYNKLMINVGRFQLMITGVIITGFIAFGRGFINDIWKMNKDGFSYDSSYFVGVFLLLPCLVTFTQQIGNSLLIVKDRIKYRCISIAVTAILSVCLSLFLTSVFDNYEAIWSAISIFIGKMIGMIIIMNIIYKRILDIDIKKFFKECHFSIMPTLVVVLMIGIGLDYLIVNKSVVLFVIKIMIFIFIYVILLYRYALKKSERVLVNKYLKKIITFVKSTDE